MMEGGCEVKRRLVSSQMLPSDCPDTLVSRPRVLKAAAFKGSAKWGNEREGEGGDCARLAVGTTARTVAGKAQRPWHRSVKGRWGPARAQGRMGGGNQPRSFSRQARINRVGQTWYNYAVG